MKHQSGTRPKRSVVVGCFALALLWASDEPLLGMGLDFGGGGDDPPPEFVSEVVGQIGAFRSPTRVALTDDGQIYVSDTGRGQVAIFDVTGRRLGTLTGVGEPLGLAVGEYREPVCRLLGRRGRGGRRGGALGRLFERSFRRFARVCDGSRATYAFVGDMSDGSVRVFINGERRLYLGRGRSEFLQPNGVAVSGGRVYVVDSAAHGVFVYRLRTMRRMSSFGSLGAGDGELDFPTDIAIDESTGEVFVSDFNNARIAVFDRDGVWLRNLAAPANEGGDPAFYRPAGLGLDGQGRLYVVDNALASVTVMDRAGDLIDLLGYQQGTYWTGELRLPIDAVSDGTYVYVTSNGEGRLNVFEVAP